MQDRCCVTRQPVIEAQRRVRKAPTEYTRKEPPEFYGAPGSMWRTDLTKRAREIIDKVWPSRQERAEMRWEATLRRAAFADTEEARKAATRSDRDEAVEVTQGGLVRTDGGDGDEWELLPAGQLLTLAQFDEIQAQFGWDADSSVSKWTVDKIKAQLKLRNLERYLRARLDDPDQVLNMALRAKSLLAAGGRVRTSGKKRPDCVKLLKSVLQVEHTCTQVRAVVAAAEREAEREEGRRERGARRGRGVNNSRYP
jgi:hypothetical protein